MWFEDLVGFREESPGQVRELLSCEDETITSSVNDQSFGCGQLEVLSLAELRNRVGSIDRSSTGNLQVSEVVADVQKLHCDPANEHALFQVASQFNLLEMVSDRVTPEQGVGIYERDFTQGPACAIAAGAGTIYRNYFVAVNGQIGQSASNQIDCLSEMGDALDNHGGRLWNMSNGYALATEQGLLEITECLSTMDDDELEQFRSKLQIGVHWNPQVTLRGACHQVSQAYCSALPVAYSRHSDSLWECFARNVLQASYESTLNAAAINAARTGNHAVYLTLLGGGAFGNRGEWIYDAMTQSLQKFSFFNLDVRIVSYGRSNPDVRDLARKYA